MTNSRWELTLLSLLAAAYTIYFAKALLFPICLATILYFLFGPLIRFLSMKKVPRFIGAGIVVIGFVLISSFAISRLVGPAAEWLNRAPRDLVAIEKKLSFIKKPIEKFTDATDKVEEMASVRAKSQKKIDVHFDNSLSIGNVVFRVTSSAVSTSIATLLLLYFLLIYGDDFLERCGRGIRVRSGIDADFAKEIEKGITRYLVTSTCINAGLSIAIGAALWLLDIPNAALWGVMAGLLNFVPYVGSLVGTSIVFLVSLLSFDTTWQAIWPPVSYFLINSIEGQFITPVLVGGRLSLSPLAILISMMTWGWAWGVEGAILSVPFLAIFKIVCDHIPKLNNLGRMLES